jgi:hypothetical protein
VLTDVSDEIYALTRGHAGFCIRSLQCLKDRFFSDAKQGQPIEDSDVLLYLHSQAFVDIMKQTRAVPNLNFLSDLQWEIIQKLFVEKNIGMPQSEEASIAVNDLLILGLLSPVSGQLEFSCPLLKAIAMARYYCCHTNENISDFDTFLEKTIALMNPQVFQNSFSTAADQTPLERQWQMEFYRCASMLLPLDCYIFPDVGREFGSHGK